MARVTQLTDSPIGPIPDLEFLEESLGDASEALLELLQDTLLQETVYGLAWFQFGELRGRRD